MTTPAEGVSTAADGRLRQGGRVLLLSLYTALRSLKLYPVENTTVQKALDDLEPRRARCSPETDLEIRLAGDFIFVNATCLRLELDNYASFSHILAMLRAFSIGGLRVHATANRREWQILLSLLLSLSERGSRRTGSTTWPSDWAVRRSRGSGSSVPFTRRTTRTPSRRRSRPSASIRRAWRSPRTSSPARDSAGPPASSGSSAPWSFIVDQVLNNKTSLVGLTTIRDYDEYTFTHSRERLHLLGGPRQEARLHQAPALRPRA